MADILLETTPSASEELSLPPQLEDLSKLIAEKPEALATGGDDLRRTALEATKFIFDLALQTEEKSRIIVNDLLTSISPSYAPQTRSQKRKRGASPSPQPENPISLMKETPINQLFVEGMSDEQMWAQLELRAQNVCEVLDFALDGPPEEAESDTEEAEEGRKLKKMRQVLVEEGLDPDELEGMEFDEEGEDEDESEEDEDEEEEDEEEESEDDGEGDAELGEDVQVLRDPSDEDEEDEPDIGEPSSLNGGKRTIKMKSKRGGHPVLDDGFFDLAAFNAEIEAAESKSVSRGKLGKDDDDDEDDDDEGADEEVDYFTSVDDTTAFEEDDLEEGDEPFYKDFFEPPRGVKPPKAKKATKPENGPPPSKGKVRFHEEVRVKKIKAKGKNLPVSAMFYEEEEDGEDYEEGEEEDDTDDDDEGEEGIGREDGTEVESVGFSDSSEAEDVGDVSMGEDDEDEDDGYETIGRLKDDLFAEDDDDDEERHKGLSSYEKRMAALREEIATLEAENVAKKDWTLMGEATSRSRPQNSLLEEDLEFERVMKSVPVITEEVVHSLEERIKARIIESQFDDVVRKRPVDDKPFLPSRFFELQDTKSKQSLAEIYEDEYTVAQFGGIAGEDRDGKLKKEHQEIEKLWENLCGKLDALCNAHFTPKAPKATITTVSNVAAATLESALPTTKATTTMLAPEEVYASSANNLRARSEMTPAEKRAFRNKQKKLKKKANDAIYKTAEKIGRPKGVGDVKRQKDAALKSLVKGGKGVTVVGKKSKELGTKRGNGKGKS
ncbi:Mpp10 protein-domain-containing protein [Trametes maxima]|nr:Mpp10 protein-domain-containing protein [Trametes maxima]